MATTTAATFAFLPSSPSTEGKNSSARRIVALPSLQTSQSFSGRVSSKAIFKQSLTRTRSAAGEGSGESSPDISEILGTLQESWDKIEDKYAVAVLGFSGVVALWISTGMISAIDRLPVLPGVLELIGIGYTGWFAYQNLIFKPDREALIEKISGAINDITGS